MNAEKLSRIRAEMPVTENKTYLNTGTSGPLTRLTVNTLSRESARELEEGRASIPGYVRLFESKAALRQSFAALIGATADEIALTHHTTEGMNIVSHGLNLQPGDEIVTTTMEHEGGLLPLYTLKQRRGVSVSAVDLMGARTDAEILRRLEAAITPRTRLLVVSHVTWNTGQRLPLAEIAALAHKHHALTLVDAAQSIGAIPVNVRESGVDFYAMSGQKWLCGPEGTGALFIRRDRLGLVSPTYLGYASLLDPMLHDFDGAFMLADGARRFEVGTVSRPGIHAQAANLRWLAEEVGWEWIYTRISALAGYAHDALSALPGVTVITPNKGESGLVTFNLDGYDPARVSTHLTTEGIIIRFLKHPYALRVSTGFYNTEADIDRLAAALKVILARRPNDLPEYISPW